MFKKYIGKNYCFSPPVMLATFIIEFGFAIHTIWRYKMDTVKRLAVSMLFALGTFQLAEYMVCGGLGISGVDWARFGYVAITLLPALGIHMISAIAGKKNQIMIKTAYITCAMFVGFYLLGANAMNGQTCYANYAVFHAAQVSGWPFAIYYYGWLFIGSYLSWIWGNELLEKKRALWSMTLGYMAFILPTTFFNLIDPSTVKGIPSIMCGFAVLFAFVLVTKVLPETCSVSKKSIKISNLRLKF